MKLAWCSLLSVFAAQPALADINQKYAYDPRSKDNVEERIEVKMLPYQSTTYIGYTIYQDVHSSDLIFHRPAPATERPLLSEDGATFSRMCRQDLLVERFAQFKQHAGEVARWQGRVLEGDEATRLASACLAAGTLPWLIPTPAALFIDAFIAGGCAPAVAEVHSEIKHTPQDGTTLMRYMVERAKEVERVGYPLEDSVLTGARNLYVDRATLRGLAIDLRTLLKSLKVRDLTMNEVDGKPEPQEALPYDPRFEAPRFAAAQPPECISAHSVRVLKAVRTALEKAEARK